MKSQYTLEDAAQAVTRHLAPGWSADALYGTDHEETYNVADADGEYVCTITVSLAPKHAPGPLFATR